MSEQAHTLNALNAPKGILLQMGYNGAPEDYEKSLQELRDPTTWEKILRSVLTEQQVSEIDVQQLIKSVSFAPPEFGEAIANCPNCTPYGSLCEEHKNPELTTVYDVDVDGPLPQEE
jgi:hypothetical protein